MSDISYGPPRPQPGLNYKLSDAVNHPPHYGEGADDPYEAIKVIEIWLARLAATEPGAATVAFHIGTVLKYIARAGKKPGEPMVQDLKKARWYLDRAIDRKSVV